MSNPFSQDPVFQWSRLSESGLIRVTISFAWYPPMSADDAVQRIQGRGYSVAAEAASLIAEGQPITELRERSLVLTLVRSVVRGYELQSVVRSMKLKPPPLSLALLAREIIFAREIEKMGLDGVVIGHKPGRDTKGLPIQLHLCSAGERGYLDVYPALTEVELGDDEVPNGVGFLFLNP